MHWRHRFLQLAWAVLALAACASVDFVAHDYPGTPGSGLDHERWTRGARIYENLETAAIVSVSLLAPEFADALTTTIAIETPALGVRDALGFDLPRPRAAMVVILSSQRQAWERLGPPATPWSLSLQVGDTAPQTPAHILALDPPPGFERFFPAWNLWAHAWLVEFDVDARVLSSSTITLDVRAVGGIGARLVWP